MDRFAPTALLTTHISLPPAVPKMVMERRPHVVFLGLGLESQALSSPFLLLEKHVLLLSHVFPHTSFSVSTLCL